MAVTTFALQRPEATFGQRLRQFARLHGGVFAYGSLLLILVLAAIAADFFPLPDPERESLIDRLTPPGFLGGESRFMLGTDHLGRDLLARVIFGARASLIVGVVGVLVSGMIGGLAGLLSGQIGGWFEEVVMMLADIQLAFPFMLLAIAIIAALGPSLINLIFVVAIGGWVTYARVVRAQVLTLREREFIVAAHCIGASTPRIIFRHLLPNLVSSLVVVATLDLARIIILESTLSFLGLGVRPPTPSWGSMLADGREHLNTAWWIATFPGLALFLTSLTVNRLGDELLQVLDPTSRR